jgi:glutamine synthetase
LTGEGPGPALSAATPFPQSLGEALSALERDAVLSTWLPADLLRIYLSVKDAEQADVAQLSSDDLYERHAHAY